MFIPNRGFELRDLIGNILGVTIVVVVYKIKKKYE
jgi:VanZ family protein